MRVLVCDDQGYFYRIALPPQAKVDPQDCVVRIPCDPPLPLIGDEYRLCDFFLLEAATHREIPGLELLQKIPKDNRPLHQADALAGQSRVQLLAIVNDRVAGRRPLSLGHDAP